MATYIFVLNSKQVHVDCADDVRLLWVLRDLGVGRRRPMVHHGGPAMSDDLPVLRLRGLQRRDARELAESLGAEATILADESLPVGGYGDVGMRAVAVAVTARSVRAVARHLAARQDSRAETVSVLVEIDDADGIRHQETLTYRVMPGQGTVQAAEAALRALPGISEALDRSLW